jgi:hypothetical protein
MNDRASIILPATYFAGRQTSDVPKELSFSARIVALALSVICCRVKVICLGGPVDPLVRKLNDETDGVSQFLIKEKDELSNSVSGGSDSSRMPDKLTALPLTKRLS